jgi:hypothetical protein
LSLTKRQIGAYTASRLDCGSLVGAKGGSLDSACSLPNSVALPDVIARIMRALRSASREVAAKWLQGRLSFVILKASRRLPAGRRPFCSPSRILLCATRLPQSERLAVYVVHRNHSDRRPHRQRPNASPPPPVIQLIERPRE